MTDGGGGVDLAGGTDSVDTTFPSEEAAADGRDLVVDSGGFESADEAKAEEGDASRSTRGPRSVDADRTKALSAVGDTAVSSVVVVDSRTYLSADEASPEKEGSSEDAYEAAGAVEGGRLTNACALKALFSQAS